VAIDFALERPHLTRSLVAVDSALGGYPYTMNFNMRAHEDGLERAKENWLAHPFFGPAQRNPAVTARLRQMVNDWSGWQWFNHDPSRAPEPLPYHRLKDIKASTLIIVGEQDVPDFQGIADTLVRDIPNARKVVLPAVGHMSNMEAPEKFNEVVLSFLVTGNTS
jgi:pimeloyl-ACP methyl ester carboxylesterase